MAEYIEREEAIETVAFYLEDPDGVDHALQSIKDIPSADVQPVKHGRWIESFEQIVDLTYKVKRCSICGKTKPMKIFEHEDCLFNYCPNCGARMDGAE